MNSEMEQLLAKRREAQEELTEARAAMPAHSVRPGQLMRLEDAEERLAEIEERIASLQKDASA